MWARAAQYPMIPGSLQISCGVYGSVSGPGSTYCGGLPTSPQVTDSATYPGADPNGTFAPYHGSGASCTASALAGRSTNPAYTYEIAGIAGLNLYWSYNSGTGVYSFRLESTTASWLGFGLSVTTTSNPMLGATAVIGGPGMCGLYTLQNTEVSAVLQVHPATGLVSCDFLAPEPATGLYVLLFNATSLGSMSFSSWTAGEGSRRRRLGLSSEVPAIVARGGSLVFAQHVDQDSFEADFQNGDAAELPGSGTTRLAHAAIMATVFIGVFPLGVFFPAFVKPGVVGGSSPAPSRGGFGSTSS